MEALIYGVANEGKCRLQESDKSSSRSSSCRLFFVPGAGLEPARPLQDNGF